MSALIKILQLFLPNVKIGNLLTDAAAITMTNQMPVLKVRGLQGADTLGGLSWL